ncbi:unnamed protein product [Coffea canephora]|uniref:DH200=94 genomic scaffold, scaffold_159 n=1 Tax=Coffea canephora TaxID=49390 RepID=A0A068V9H3_COFCA|nr:unnamed protein product [Coffea canephora]
MKKNELKANTFKYVIWYFFFSFLGLVLRLARYERLLLIKTYFCNIRLPVLLTGTTLFLASITFFSAFVMVIFPSPGPNEKISTGPDNPGE